MIYHTMEVLNPYFDIGAGYENERHLPELEKLDERLDSFSAAAPCLVHGSILSEVADTYTAPESLDVEKARQALAKSDVMYYVASTKESLALIAARELIFNSLRRGLLTQTISTLLKTKVT